MKNSSVKILIKTNLKSKPAGVVEAKLMETRKIQKQSKTYFKSYCYIFISL